MKDYILKIDCTDEKGLIYRISDIIFKYGLNIDNNSEFVDHEHDRFFFRAVIKTDKDIDESGFCGNLSAVLPKANIIFKEKAKKNVIILATKETHCLGDLLIKFYSGELNANIKAVISNHDSLRDLVEKFNLPYHFISSDDISREEHEKLVLAKMSEYSFDYAILAKYMRILSPNFVNAYEGKIINIHHSFLPAFIGANPYKQAYERGVKIIGATAHFVNNDLDEGPIIAQDITMVNHEMNWQQMREAGRYVEKNVLGKAIDLVLDDRIFIYKNKTVIF
ncbi:formyltetrahydrofolate deformylase [Campylobacter geochelonis]|uniref:Formyltetrahydrofolate deformylase n=1 Tax=Campylobacter geochelonis TaxID=1780362 RepID=A0A128EHK8_9BACT|nr:formyltetrahydrofolate deformylase [Campylobacter geochelonis]QKF71109.1 formyltetrahydrofolate deformylase [Campylobacter geochelonis]CZE48316.1 formyltetrahydrofolate deformylase [Campylobacter geochelonis]CZE48911.1 formyltetrahydrofolate deformylase [Campylobacter geochelonis]CZE50075.1 formyltetrahydrofolate deformylase [Campylobacter geochelonis]